jgi:hypothetical protein
MLGGSTGNKQGAGQDDVMTAVSSAAAPTNVTSGSRPQALLPGIVPSLLLLAQGACRIQPAAAAAAAAATAGRARPERADTADAAASGAAIDAVTLQQQQEHADASVAADAAAAAAAAACHLFTADVAVCCRDLAPLAQYVLCQVQRLLNPNQDEPGGHNPAAAAAAAAAAPQDTQKVDGRKALVKARQQAALAKLKAQQAAFLQGLDDQGRSEDQQEEGCAGDAAAAAGGPSQDMMDSRQHAPGGVGGSEPCEEGTTAALAAAAAAASHHNQQQQLEQLQEHHTVAEVLPDDLAAPANTAAAAGGPGRPGHHYVGQLQQQQQGISDALCVVCHEDDSSRGPLAWLAHLQVSWRQQQKSYTASGAILVLLEGNTHLLRPRNMGNYHRV